MILVDTSIWIDLFSSKPQTKIIPSHEQLLQMAVCLPVLQEVLQGIADERSFRRISEDFLALPCIGRPIDQSTILHAVDIYRSGRKRGLTIRSSIDCLIAAIAIENSCDLWHRDRDFDLIARYTKLSVVKSI